MTGKPEKKILYYNLLIGVIGAICFIPFLGDVHLFDWDEINFAESAREMIVSKDFLTVQINFVPFWEKPPLFIWMQAASMKIFGIHEFAARFPNAVCGIISLLAIFNIGRRIKDIRFGILWTILYGGSLLPFLYFKSGIIDPWFNLFIFLGIYSLYLYLETPVHKSRNAAISAMFIGLAILTKGPVALLIFMIAGGIYMIVKRFHFTFHIGHILIFFVVLAFTGGFWFILQIIDGNYTIIADFIEYQIRLFKTQDAGHGGFLFYHFVVLFFGVFPASVIAVPSFFPSKYRNLTNTGFYVLMLILFWVVLILFTIVRTKIVHYSSMCYFPLTFLGAWSVYHAELTSVAWKKTIRIIFAGIGGLIALLLIPLTFIDHYKDFILAHNWITDPFAVECLKADGGWKGFEFVSAIFLITGIVMYFKSSQKNSNVKPLLYLTSGMVLFMFLSMLLIVPKIEAYSQRAAIEFFKSVRNKDVYLDTKGYKSYAHLFYGEMKMQDNSNYLDKEWLVTGANDKPVYFSVKITRREKFVKDHPAFIFLYEKNGFAFYMRPATKFQ